MGISGSCFCNGYIICIFCVRLTVAVVAIIFGSIVALKPKETINAQIALYRPFNWKLEPISWEKEIRNTRVMGICVLILGLILLLFTFLGK